MQQVSLLLTDNNALPHYRTLKEQNRGNKKANHGPTDSRTTKEAVIEQSNEIPEKFTGKMNPHQEPGADPDKVEKEDGS